MNKILRSHNTISLPVLVCFIFCAGKSTRAPAGTEPGFALVSANVQTFPDGADKSLPQVKKFTHEDITLLAWSKDFARGNATLLEIESTSGLKDIRLEVNKKDFKLNKSQNGLFALHANSADSKRTENTVVIYRGRTALTEFKIPVLQKEYPVAVSKMTVNNFSNQSKPMKPETIKWIEEGRKKKMHAFISADENFLTSELRYPRDEHKITSPFFIKRVYERFKLVNGKKKKLPGKTSFHGGTDLKGLTGAPIFAIADGVVNLAEKLYYDGNIVMIDHGNGIISGYMHQSELVVKAGERVKAGQLIGKTGATGMVTGPHLHIFLHVHGVKVDPLSLLHLPIRPAK